MAVADRVDVQLGRVAEELVDQDRVLLGGLDGLLDTGLQAALVVDDPHRAAAEDERRPDQQRIPELAGDLQRVLIAGGRIALRLEQAELLDELVEALAVLGQIDAVGRGADDLDAGLLQGHGQLQRRLAAELDDDAVGLLLLDDGHHVFESERLEVQPVRRVVVRADRLGVAVDHDRLDADLLERKGGMAAAVVELDALPDPVGSAAKDHDLAPRGRFCLALALIRRVQVRRGGLELGAAGVDHLVDRVDALRLAVLAELGLRHAGDRGHVLVAEAELLGLLEHGGLGQLALVLQKLALERDDVLDVVQEPRIDLGQGEEFLDGHVAAKGLCHVPELVPVVASQPLFQLVRGERLVDVLVAEAVAVDLQGTDGLAHRLLERPADGHGLADRFHLDRQLRRRLRELLEREPRPLDDAVIDRRLEARGRLLRDVVGDLVERVAHGQLGGDLGDREAGRLGGQGRAA